MMKRNIILGLLLILVVFATGQSGQGHLNTVVPVLNVDNVRIDGNTISTISGDLNVTSFTGGVFQFNDNAFRAGLDAVEYVETGHGGGNGFINAVGDGGLDFRFEGNTLATFTDFGHLHLMTDVDQKHTLKIITANNLNDTGLAFENSGGSFTHTIFRTDVGSNRADLVFAAGLNSNIDLLTNSFKIHGGTGVEGKLEILDTFQISSGSPGLDKVLTSDANGIATWQPASGGGWTDDGTVVRLTTSTDDVVIGANTGFGAQLELVADTPGTVGGFASGAFQVRSPSTAVNANAVITGHNSNGGNKQLWYFGSTSSSNDNIAFINRQNSSISLSTNNITRFTVDQNGKIFALNDLQFSAYPNTRDDGTPINILGTDASGNLISGPNEVIHIGGNFVDTIDQTIAVAGTSQTITFNTNSSIDDISHTAGSDTFTINTDGVYTFILAPQLAQGSGSAVVEFWIQKNGTDIVNSGVQESIGANSQSLPLLRWTDRFVATDTIKFIWASNSTATSLDNITSSYGGPNIPSIMVGIHHVGG